MKEKTQLENNWFGRSAAGDDWALVEVSESDLKANIAMPLSWLEAVDGDIEVMDRREAESKADFTAAPGSLKSAFKNIDDLFATVRDLYTLYDEGYISNANALKTLK
jgi:hypothetical protein